MGEADLSWPRATPWGPGRNTHERTLIKKSGNEDKCFRGSGEHAGPWRSQNSLLYAFGVLVMEWPKEISLLSTPHFLVVYFSWHWKNFPFPPGCSNSHLLTAVHAGLQLTLGRRFPLSPLSLCSLHREVVCFFLMPQPRSTILKFF